MAVGQWRISEKVVVNPVGERPLDEVVFDLVGVDESIATEARYLLSEHGRLAGSGWAGRHDGAAALARRLLPTQVPVDGAVVEAGPVGVGNWVPVMGRLNGVSMQDRPRCGQCGELSGDVGA